MPHIFRNTFGGFLYLMILFLTASIGVVLIMAPLLPLMILYPYTYRKIMDNLMGLWLILPVVSMCTFKQECMLSFSETVHQLSYKLLVSEVWEIDMLGILVIHWTLVNVWQVILCASLKAPVIKVKFSYNLFSKALKRLVSPLCVDFAW